MVKFMKFMKILAILLLLIFITGSGCVTDTPQVENGTIENVTKNISVVTENKIIIEKELQKIIISEPEKANPIQNVMGSFYSNEIVSLKVPTDGVRVIEHVADFPTLIAMSGNRYVEVQIEIRNDKDKVFSIDLSQFTLLDSERYVHTIDVNQRYLRDNLDGVTISPLSKINGSLLFQVSTKRN